MIDLIRGPVSISSGVIAASGSYTTDAMDTGGIEGFFSLQWTTTGDGTMKAEVLSSNDGSSFIDINADITTGQTKITGPAANGINIVSFLVIPCSQIKIKFTETGGANSITIVARLKVF